MNYFGRCRSGCETGQLLLGDLKPLPVSAICSLANDDFDIGGAVISNIIYRLNRRLLIQPTVKAKGQHISKSVDKIIESIIHFYLTHANWGVLSCTLRVIVCFPVYLTTASSIFSFKTSSPCCLRADMGITSGSLASYL